MAVLLVDLGLNEEAATMMGAFDALCEVHGIRPPAGFEELIARRNPLQRVTAALEPEMLRSAFERGSKLSLDEAVNLAVKTPIDRFL